MLGRLANVTAWATARWILDGWYAYFITDNALMIAAYGERIRCHEMNRIWKKHQGRHGNSQKTWLESSTSSEHTMSKCFPYHTFEYQLFSSENMQIEILWFWYVCWPLKPSTCALFTTLTCVGQLQTSWQLQQWKADDVFNITDDSLREEQ